MNKILMAACLLPMGMGNASDTPPEMKEGLWSISRQTIDNPGNKKTSSTSTICRNHAYDQHTRTLAKSTKGCMTLSESFESGKYSLSISCAVGGTTVESKGTTTLQGDTAHSETHATYSPAMAGVSDTTMIMDQKYIGSCPAGAQPGDMTNADGTVVHLWKH